MLLTAILSLLSGLPGLLGNYFTKKQEIAKAQMDNMFAIQLEQQKQIGAMAQEDAQRASVMIGATSQKFKYCVFGLISYPFLMCMFGHASYAQSLFDSLNALPQWYMVLYTSVIAVIWGIPVPGNIMSSVIEGVKGTVQNYRAHTLAKLDRKTYYAQLKASGVTLTQAGIALNEKVLDSLEKPE